MVLGAPLYYLLTAEKILDWKQFRAGEFLFRIAGGDCFRRHTPAHTGYEPQPRIYTSTLPFVVASAYNYQLGYGYWESAKTVLNIKLHQPVGWALRALSVNTFGILFLLPLFAIRENRAHSLAMGPLHRGTVYLSMILFSGSYERPLAICFPAVLIMALNGLERLRDLTGAGPRWALAFAIALVPLTWLYPKRIDPLFEVQALIFIVFVAAALYGKSGHLVKA